MDFNNAKGAEISARETRNDAAPALFSLDLLSKVGSKLADPERAGQEARTIQTANLADLLRDPVIDSRLSPYSVQDAKSVIDSLLPEAAGGIDNCANRALTKTKEESLESTAKGNSILHRMYEVAVRTPSGKVEAKDFESVYGAQAASKMQELGITQVLRSGQRVNVHLKAPQEFQGEGGSIIIDKYVAFSSTPRGGSVALDSIRGVTARSGLFQFAIESVDLHPRKEGFLSGVVRANLSATNVCATPDGKIYR